MMHRPPVTESVRSLSAAAAGQFRAKISNAARSGRCEERPYRAAHGSPEDPAQSARARARAAHPRALSPWWRSGLDNAGKTTVLKRFNGEDIDEIEPTLGFEIKTLSYRGFTLNLWDVGGQQTIRSYWRNYFEQTDGVIWVVDSADKLRLNDCRRELQALLHEEKLAGATLLVFANKQDIEGEPTARKKDQREHIPKNVWYEEELGLFSYDSSFRRLR
eukprot:scaffold466_cov238-Pinguiococcus_pyrenoidosus.AAC.8